MTPCRPLPSFTARAAGVSTLLAAWLIAAPLARAATPPDAAKPAAKVNPAKPTKTTKTTKPAKGEAAPPAEAPAAAVSEPPAGSSALEDIKKTELALKKVIAKQPPTWSPEKDAKNSEVRRLVNQFLDFDELSRRALARHWDGLTPAQRKDFTDTLHELVERSYLKQMHGGADWDIRYEREEKQGHEATVFGKLHAVSRGKKVIIALEYKLLYKGRWVAYDLVTDEQSMLETYRAEFNKIIAKESFDALIKRMKKKLDDQAAAAAK